ncbi:TIGR00341 family protein [Salarchaeum japonicum]|uniref:TIGR00341 family protein n=1 Tax=Salarchaeum japonicum TaxID=555573 RepID=UPI003C74094A
MRLIQVTIPAGKRDAVLGALDDEGVDYVVTEEVSGREYTAVVYFPLPTNAVEPVLATLREVGLGEDAYTVVLSAETVISRHFDQLQAEYEEEGSEDRIAREELKAKAGDLASAVPTYAIMTVVSAVIATAGLLLDSPATVVGSMVIAPLIGPAMAASVGTVVDDSDLFRRGVRMQALGLGLAVGAAAVFALGVRTLNLIPPGLDPSTIGQVRERLAPDFLSLAVALGAGVAGAISLTTGVSSALVGVMIAVALIPPAATVGVGIAYGLPSMALGSGVLVLVNMLSINLAALGVLWLSGYRPEDWFRQSEARAATVKRVGALVAAIAVLSVFLGGVTLASYQHANTEQTVSAETEAALTAPEYADLTFLSADVEFTDGIVFTQSPTRVIITVGAPPGGTYPGLADVLDDRIDAALGTDVAVQVRFIEIDTASG